MIALIILSLFGLLAGLVGWLMPIGYVLYAIIHYGYWFLLFITLWFAWNAYQAWKHSGNQLRLDRSFGIPAIVIGWVTIFVWVHGEFRYNISWDEPNQTATAVSMHLERTIQVPIRTHTLADDYHILSGFLDKRPPLYAFFVSIVHDLTGFRPNNGFYVNAALVPILLTIIFLMGKRLKDTACGLYGVLAMGTLPLIIAVSHGAGFELLSLTLVAFCLYMSLLYAQAPHQAYLNVLLLATVWLSQTRYEALIFCICVFAVIGLSAWKRRSWDLSNQAYGIVFLFIPAIWHRRIFQYDPSFWETQTKKVDVPFSWDYIQPNWGHALNAFFSNNPELLNSLLLSVGGCTGLIMMSVYAIKRLKSWPTWPSSLWVICIFQIGVGALFILLLSYFWGQLTDPIVTRLTLPIYLGFLVAILWLMSQPTMPKAFLYVCWGGLILHTLMWTVPMISLKKWENIQVFSTNFKNLVTFIQEHEHEPYLIVSSAPAFWASFKKDHIGFKDALARKAQLKAYMQRPSRPKVYIMEWLEWDYIHNQLVSFANKYESLFSLTQDPDFILEEVKRYTTYSGQAGLVLYEIKDITSVEAVEWLPKKGEPRADFLQRLIANLP